MQKSESRNFSRNWAVADVHSTMFVNAFLPVSASIQHVNDCGIAIVLVDANKLPHCVDAFIADDVTLHRDDTLAKQHGEVRETGLCVCDECNNPQKNCCLPLQRAPSEYIGHFVVVCGFELPPAGDAQMINRSCSTGDVTSAPEIETAVTDDAVSHSVSALKHAREWGSLQDQPFRCWKS